MSSSQVAERILGLFSPDSRNPGFSCCKGSKTWGRERSMVVAREGSAVGTGILDLVGSFNFKRRTGESLVLD